MKISKFDKHPERSIILKGWDGAVDYIDSYVVTFENMKKLGIDRLAPMLLNGETPEWVKALFAVRNFFARFFYLKTETPSDNKENENIHDKRYLPGDKIGIFPVTDRSDAEIVMGLNDRHLLFRVSVLSETDNHSDKCTLYMTTVVRFNNLLGKLYFFPVKPFHKIIMRRTMKQFLKQFN